MLLAEHKSVPGHVLLAASLVTVSGVFWVLERSVYSWGFGPHYFVAALIIAWYLRLLLHDMTAATMTSFYQIFYGIGMLASSAIISSGAEMIEIGASGTVNGLFWLMLAFFVIGMEATILGYSSGHRLRLPVPALRLPAGLELMIMLSLLLPILALALYVFALTGGPVMLGVDRVTFWRNIAPAGTTILPTLVSQTFFFVAFLYLWRVRNHGSMFLVRLVLIGYLLTGLFVLGQKLSLFILFLNMWLIVKIGVMPKFHFRIIHIFTFLAIMALLIIIVAVSYIINDKEVGFILVRAALQAQLLWSIAENSLQMRPLPIRPECYFGCDWYLSGMDYISHMFLPVGLFDFYRDNGTTLSGFMPALPIFTLGPVLAVIIHILTGFVLGVLQYKIVTALGKKQPIYGFLIFKMHFSITMIWFAAMQTAIPGLLTVLASIIIYRMAGILQVGRSAAFIRI